MQDQQAPSSDFPKPENTAGDAAAPASAAGNPAEAGGAQAGAAAGPGATLADELSQAQAKAAENYDLYVRAVADMENIRRRAAEDVSKAHKYAIESFAEAMVPVRDSLEMALKVDNPSIQSLKEGVEATLRQLASAFDRNRLMEVNPVGEKFDPNRHQAISMVPAAGSQPPTPPNHVVTVLQKGYLINDRILRPALVIVAQG